MLLLEQQRPRFVHAETMPAYMPKPRDPRMDESMRIAREINRLKVTDPEQGDHIYDRLVNQLLSNTTAMARSLEDGEDPNWTALQRCVWRYSKLGPHEKWEVIEDRSILVDIKAYAVVNAGRWIVKCPLMTIHRQPCMGAQYASFDDRRFHCDACGSEMINRRWVEVLWPTDIAAIEDALSQRPEDSQRHWDVGETVEDLMNQNIRMVA